MAILSNRAKLEEFWLLWEFFNPLTLPSNDDWGVLTEFWINKLETVRDMLIKNPIWLHWYLNQGLRHFRTWSSECSAIDWKSDGTVRPCPWSYLRQAVRRENSDWLMRHTMTLAFQYRSGVLDIAQILDYQLQVVYPLPPTLDVFDDLELRTCLDSLPRIAVFPDKEFDLEWLTF